MSLPDVASAPDWGRPGLSRRGRRVALAAIEAMLCDRRGAELVAPDPAWAARVLDDYDRLLGAAGAQVRVGMRVLLWLLEWLPIAALGRFGAFARMSRMPLAARVRYLQALEAHPWAGFAVLLVGCKVPMMMPAFERDEALAMTGFDRPSTAARRRLRGPR